MAELAIKGSTSPEDVEVIGEMRIMGRRGDTHIIWDPGNADEVEHARKTFDDLRKKRFVAFRVGRGGARGEQITEFDPGAEKMILAPPMAGG